MREFLKIYSKSLCSQLIILAVIIAGYLAWKGQLYLASGIIIGYLVAAIYIYIMAFRIWRVAHLSVRKGKAQMWLGLIMRLAIIFIILRTAALQSTALFFTVVAAFLAGFIIFMINFIIYTYHKNME